MLGRRNVFRSQQYYERGNQPGALLAFLAKQQTTSSSILKIKNEKGEINIMS